MEDVQVLGDGEHVVWHPQKGTQLPDERARTLPGGCLFWVLISVVLTALLNLPFLF